LFYISSPHHQIRINSVLAPYLYIWTWYGVGMDQTRTRYGTDQKVL